jgi:hypothetical protein
MESDPTLRETLAALEMPPSGLRTWLEHNKSFCLAHGGERRYAELLTLYDECLALLDAEGRPCA